MITIEFIPYTEIEHLGSARRVKKLLDSAKDNKIVLMEGRLRPEEEKDLIHITMEEIDNDFKGIELAVINPATANDAGYFSVLKEKMINLLLGNRIGFTIVGPSKVIKKIKRDPSHINLYLRDIKRK